MSENRKIVRNKNDTYLHTPFCGTVAEPINMSTPQMHYVNEKQPKQYEGTKARITSITSDNLFCHIYKRECKCP